MADTTIDDLFQQAEAIGKDEGTPIFSDAAMDVMNSMALDYGLQLNAGLGLAPADMKAEDPLLVAFVLDNSGSIDGIVDGPAAVCEGHKLYLDTLSESKEKNGILVGTWLLNDILPIHPFVTLDNATRLVAGTNYSARGMTPLYRKVCEVLSILNLKMQVEYFDAGCTCRAILVVVTDGNDQDYNITKARTAAECKTLAQELGELLIIQFMGISDGVTPFEDVAISMGVSANQIMLPGADPHEIRAAFDLASRSALSASQSADTFSQVAMNGFVT